MFMYTHYSLVTSLVVYADNSSQDGGSSSPTSSGPPLDDASSTDTMLTRQVTLLRALDEDEEDNVSTMSIKIEFD